jgi:hypothetical protein
VPGTDDVKYASNPFDLDADYAPGDVTSGTGWS